MLLCFNLTQGLQFKCPIGKKVLLTTIVVAPLIFNSCSIFKPKPDNSAARNLEKVYKAQRIKKPNLSNEWPSNGKTPFWYRGKRLANDKDRFKTKLPELHSTKSQSFISKNFFKTPEIFVDDLDQASLRKVILNQLETMKFTNPEKVEQYKGGKDKLFGFFVGQVMKASKGSADPQAVNELLKTKLG